MSEVAERTIRTNEASNAIASADREERRREPDHAVEVAIKRRIDENGPYAFYFREVTCECSAGVVKVCGRVSTDRLKHALWSLILGLDGITEIDDQLDVIRSTGLSSVRPR